MTIFLGKGGGEKKFTSSRGGDKFFFTLGEGGDEKNLTRSRKNFAAPPHLINERSLNIFEFFYFVFKEVKLTIIAL